MSRFVFVGRAYIDPTQVVAFWRYSESMTAVLFAGSSEPVRLAATVEEIREAMDGTT